MISLPAPRGLVSECLLAALVEPVHSMPEVPPVVPHEEDLHLSLYLCYELHYRGLPGVDAEWEWEPSLLELRRRLERSFEADLRARVPAHALVAPDEVDIALREIERGDTAPSLSRHLARDADGEQFREFLIHRSAYQLKEADPHSWGLPRLHGRPKAAMVEIQVDEYGAGNADRMHSALFARTMEAMNLDASYGAYVGLLPAPTLATVNLMSLFGLHRRLRGSLVGHLALFEMSSSVPNRRYADGLRRLGYGPVATDFFDEHVVADAVHESVAAVDLAGGLAQQDPTLTGDILWGALALRELEARFAEHLLDAWASGSSSLLAAPEMASA